MKSLILVKLFNILNVWFKFKLLFKFCIKSSIRGLICEQIPILIMIKEKKLFSI